MVPADGHSIIPVNEGPLQMAADTLPEPYQLQEQILDALEALVIVLDAEGRIVMLNRACERTIEGAAERLLGMSFVTAFVPSHERDAVQRRLDRLLTEPSVRRIEALWRSTDDASRHIQWSATCIQDEDEEGLGVVLTGVDVTREHDLEREVVHADEEIRRQFGAELHDMLASHLAGTAMMASALTRKAEKGDAVNAEDLRRLTKLVREAMEQVRALSHSFVAPELESDDLVEALDQLVNRTEAASGVRCAYSVCETSRFAVPGGEVATHLYRIAQEALHNAVTHADPSQIDVVLEVTESAPVGEALVLTIQDDGCGLPADGADGVGLRNMQRRADLISASMEVEASEAGGTLVRCVLPLSADGVYE